MNLDLEERMRAALTDLLLMPYGATMKPRSSRGERADPRPMGENFPDHEKYLREWNEASNDTERLEAVEGAEKCLESWRKAPQAPQNVDLKAARAKRVCEEGVGWPAAEVAFRLGMPVSEVRQARRDNKQDPVDGRPLRSGVSAQDRARELKAAGSTDIEIAAELNVDRVTVWRWCRKAA